jgi:hypothetical protein
MQYQALYLSAIACHTASVACCLRVASSSSGAAAAFASLACLLPPRAPPPPLLLPPPSEGSLPPFFTNSINSSVGWYLRPVSNHRVTLPGASKRRVEESGAREQLDAPHRSHALDDIPRLLETLLLREGPHSSHHSFVRRSQLGLPPLPLLLLALALGIVRSIATLRQCACKDSRAVVCVLSNRIETRRRRRRRRRQACQWVLLPYKYAWRGVTRGAWLYLVRCRHLKRLGERQDHCRERSVIGFDLQHAQYRGTSIYHGTNTREQPMCWRASAAAAAAAAAAATEGR